MTREREGRSTQLLDRQRRQVVPAVRWPVFDAERRRRERCGCRVVASAVEECDLEAIDPRWQIGGRDQGVRCPEAAGQPFLRVRCGLEGMVRTSPRSRLIDANEISWAAWKFDDCDGQTHPDVSCVLALDAPVDGGWTSAELNGHASYVLGKL